MNREKIVQGGVYVKVESNMDFSAKKDLKVKRNLEEGSLAKVSKNTQKKEAGEVEKITFKEDIRSEIYEQQKSNNNAQNAISLIQTAESAIKDIYIKLKSSRELVVSVSDKTNTSSDQTAIQNEIEKSYNEINSIVDKTEFNSKKLLTGDETIELYAGSNNSVRISIPIGDMSTTGLGKEVIPGKSLKDTNVLKFESFSSTQQIRIIDKSIEDVSSEMERLSLAKNKLEEALKSEQSEENTNNITLLDSVMAKEIIKEYKRNVLEQAQNTMKAQSNHSPLAVTQFIS